MSHSGGAALARGPDTGIVAGDLLQPASLDGAFSRVNTAFYLVHSRDEGKQFETRERQAAANFAMAARQSGLQRIIYLGGLTHDREPPERVLP
jgi:uncharacterized protein YbjT (DUF2867 family)